MSCYRLYFMTDARHIRGREDIDADNDCDALAVARQGAGLPSRELWCGSRLVKEFDAGAWLRDLSR